MSTTIVTAHRGAIGLLTVLLSLGAVVTMPTSASAATACTPLTATVLDRGNPTTHAQLLTRSATEATTFAGKGFTRDRGVRFTVSSSSKTGLKAVHRLYRASNKNYFYSHDTAEIARAKKIGYRDEGTAFYAPIRAAACLIGVYSFFKGGTHRFTTLVAERTALAKAGWKAEGIRFYAGPSTVDQNFSIVAFPDTQQEVLKAGDTRFDNRVAWVAAAKKSRDVRFLLHTGDVVNWDTSDHVQYARARAAMAGLNRAGIPYAVAAGNHDTDAVCPGGSACPGVSIRAAVRGTGTFNAYLGDQVTGLAGQFEPGQEENSFQTFSAGGVRWLVLSLELWPRTEVVNWARNVVAAHATYNIAVATHSYLTASGAILQTNGGYGANSPQYLYDHLIKVYPNIRMVFSGHTGKSVVRTDTGTKGNKIVSLLLAMHDNHTNPLRMVEIDVYRDTLKTSVYAPATKTSYPAYDKTITAMGWVRPTS